MDDDGGGEIDFQEFLHLMGTKMRDLKKNEEVFNMFKVFDRDRYLFLIVFSTKNLFSNDSKKIFGFYLTFNHPSISRNGFISAEELRYAMKKLGHPISRREANKMIRRADANGDGLINYQEFYHIMMEK